MPVNDISAISANPLGMMGLDYSGVYGSYPMMGGYNAGTYGMYGSYPMLGGYGTGISGMPFGADSMMYGMGGMGMNNLAYLQGITQTQQAIEKSQVNHASDMHQALNIAEVNNLSAHNRALFQKISDDSEIQLGVRHLADLIRKGDPDGVCIEFEKLRSNIFTKFAKEINQDPTGNSKNKVDKYIKDMYSQIVSTQGQAQADFNDDMRSYSESAFMNGFKRTFLGNKGHNKRFTEEAIAEIDGTRLNDKGSLEMQQKWGNRISSWIAEPIVGGVAGTVLGTLGFCGGKLLGMPGKFKNIGKCVKWGFILGALGDGIWQLTR